ncbi:hypothetical protein FK521_29455, partial [Klebsiella pneumoniae]|nr:hypothetical protein [Klebsiella pneumoniae]
ELTNDAVIKVIGVGGGGGNAVEHMVRERIVAALATSASCFAAEKFTFLTNWYAQAEHGGFYQAQATGLYQHADP